MTKTKVPEDTPLIKQFFAVKAQHALDQASNQGGSDLPYKSMILNMAHYR